MKQVEQARRGLDEIAGTAQGRVTAYCAKPDKIFVRGRFRRAQPQRFRWRVVARKLAWGFDLIARRAFSIDLDGTRTKQAKGAARRGDDRRFQAALGGPAVDDQRDAPAKAFQDMLRPRRAD